MARRMTQMPELWALLKEQGFKGRDVPIIAGCGISYCFIDGMTLFIPSNCFPDPKWFP